MNDKTSISRKGVKRGKLRLQTLWAKPHRFSAHVTEEQEWQTEVPNVKLARVFGIVLILHIVAVGGILAFKMIERTSDDLDTTTVRAAPEIKKETAVAPVTPEVRERTMPRQEIVKDEPNIVVDDPSRLGMKHYRVRSGDNLLAVARKLGVSVSELEELNKLDEGKSVYPGMVLLVPNRRISAVQPEDIQRLLGEPVPTAVVKADIAENPVPGTPTAVVKPVAAAEAPVPATPASKAVRAETLDAPREVAAAKLEPAPAPVVRPAPAPTLAPVTTPAPAASGARTYTVVSGDTPYGIARRFGIDYQELMRANKITDARSLRVGLVINIPEQR